MNLIYELIEEIHRTAEDPYKQIEIAKNNGRKIVGCVPYFVPLELVHASGMQPVELWGKEVSTGAAGSYYPAFYCSLLFALMENALEGRYDDLSAVIIPTTCDGLRNLEENWKFARPGTTVIDYVQPAVRSTAEAHLYNKGQIKRIANKLEEVAGAKITEKAIRESINLYNNHRRSMRLFSEIAAKHTDIVTPLVRRDFYAAARSMPIEKHLALVQKTNTELLKLPEYTSKETKIILTGILVDSPALLLELEKNNIAVVGDLTVAESVRYNFDVPKRIDPYDSLAELWESVEGASVALDPQKKRGLLLSTLVKERKADGVIACIVKFCEEEEFDVPVLKKQLAEVDIPLLVLEMETQKGTSEQISTRIQAFAELMRSRV